MSVLSIIQDHCRIHALNVPTAVVGSADTTINQLFGILNEMLDDMAAEAKYNVVTQEAVWTLIGSSDQGALTTIAPNGYQWAFPRTFFDRSQGIPLTGPVSEEEWQQLMAEPDPGPWYKYRIKNDHLFVWPVPVTPFGEIAFEYASGWTIKDGTTSALKSAITNDADTFIFPEKIVRKAMMWRWKQIKGLPYAEDQTAYYNLLNNYIARDKTRPIINVGCDEPTAQPGIFVPYGNWNQ